MVKSIINNLGEFKMKKYEEMINLAYENNVNDLTPRKFDFYTDGGHGWLKVKLSLMVKLGIANRITTSSYIRNGWVFLEEDFDMSIFCHAMKDKGYKVLASYNSTNKTSKIRNYDYFMSEWVDMYRNNLKNTSMAF
jgi:hypothetical protein